MIFSKLKWQITLIAISGVLAFGCTREPVVAKVNGEAITQKDVDFFLGHAGIRGNEKLQQGVDLQKAMRKELLKNLINEKLVLQAARKKDIRVDKSEVMKVYSDIVSRFPKEEDYLSKLRARGMSKDVVIKSIEKDLIMGKFKDSLSKDIPFSDEELKYYYTRNLSLFTMPEQLRLSVIKVNTLEEAKKIRRDIEKGAKFEEMVTRYPAGHTVPGGEETGWVTVDTFPQAVAKEIRKIRTGSFGGPIKGREGYYLIKVIERKEKKVHSFDEVKENIRQMLVQQKKEERFQDWLQNERNKAKIEIVEKG